MKARKYSMSTFTAVIMILTALLFWGCSVRYVPDDSPWVEENDYYEYGGSGFHGNSPVYAPEYLNAWEMTKYYQYGERYYHEYVPDTTQAYGKSPGDFTQHNEEAYKRRETSMRSAPQQRVNSPRDANRRARLNARRRQIEQGKVEQSADDSEDARRAKLRQAQRIRNEKVKQQKEEDEDSAKQRRDKKIRDRNQ